MAIVTMAAGAGWANAKDEQVMKYRAGVMQILKWHIGAVARMVKGETPYDPGHAAHHARALEVGGRLMLEAFPDSTRTLESKSLPEVWSDREGFEDAIDALINASAAMVDQAGEGRAALGGALRDVGESCQSCHDDYRRRH